MTDIEKQLFDRLNQNLSEFNDHLLTLDRQQIIDMAARIAATHEVHQFLQEHSGLDDEEINFLLHFQNPLAVVAEQWQHNPDWEEMGLFMMDSFDTDRAKRENPLITDAPRRTEHLRKFVNVDVIATLGAIAKQKIIYHPKDFDNDKRSLFSAAVSEDVEDKTQLWHVSAYGTHLLKEHDVFVEGTYDNDIWVNYRYPDMLGYTVEINGIHNDKVMGSVYELNHIEHMEHVRRAALRAEKVTISYKDGRMETVSRKTFNDDRHRLMSESGAVAGLRYLPEDESVLAGLLRREKTRRDQTPKGTLKTHMKKLVDGRIQAEARRLRTAFQELPEPNSPNKTHFMVKLSYEFMFFAGNTDTDKLFDLLPFKSLHLSNLKGEKGVFAFIKKDDERGQPLKPSKSSLLGQLEEKVKEVKHPAPDADSSRRQASVLE